MSRKYGQKQERKQINQRIGLTVKLHRSGGQGKKKGGKESLEQRKISDNQTQNEPKQHNPRETEEGADGKEPQCKLPPKLGDQ